MNDFTTEEQISLISRIAAASIGSQGTVGGLVVAGIVSTCVFSLILLINDNFLLSYSKQ
jgi:hypothetical protein